VGRSVQGVAGLPGLCRGLLATGHGTRMRQRVRHPEPWPVRLGFPSCLSRPVHSIPHASGGRQPQGGPAAATVRLGRLLCARGGLAPPLRAHPAGDCHGSVDTLDQHFGHPPRPKGGGIQASFAGAAGPPPQVPGPKLLASWIPLPHHPGVGCHASLDPFARERVLRLPLRISGQTIR